MKPLTLSLVALLFILSYLLNQKFEENRGLKKVADGVEAAIQYHETKNAELGNRIEYLEIKIVDFEAKISAQKSLVFELQTEKDMVEQQLQKINTEQKELAVILEQKDSEILVLKNELLKYFQESKKRP